jgi:two-component system NtrC family sensor kinase
VWRADITLPDGRVLQGQLSLLPGVGYGAVLRDITRLKELDRIKSEFVSIVSHDLRTPLTAIRGYVSLLPRVGPLNDQQQDFVTRVERSMDSIVDLIADLLDIGKIEAGVDWEMAAVSLHAVVREVADRLRANAELHRHAFTVKAPELSSVLGNRRRLEQVVANLIGNAIKYTPDLGRIDVTLHEDDGFLVLQVSDTGIGISLDDQRCIFDKFYRVESEATETISGTGLGLSIVKAIIKKHSGRVWVQSELGKGSTFTVLLPRYAPDKKART